ncbi:uncharacterized protein MYCFIDRAFT_121755, partial [Pseudocercospora fijiensis CIRAD86]
VHSTIKFCKRDPKWSHEKAFNLSYLPPPGTQKTNVDHEDIDVTIHDIRPRKDSLSLGREGFQILDLESKLEYEDFFDQEKVQSIFAVELREVLLKSLGASGVLMLVREGDQPITTAHEKTDYTIDQVRSLIEEISGTLLSPKVRVQAVNVWKPLKGPVRDWPLALCDASTLNPSEDLQEIDAVFPTGFLEGYTVHYSKGQRWCYISDQKPSEMWLFNIADSASSVPGK